VADQLATPQQLASYLQSDLDAATADVLLNAATAVVQEAAGGQRILQVVDDTFTTVGLTDSWLTLPQIPVTAVESVELDGTALTLGAAGDATTTYRVVGNRLWRTDGWQTYIGEPSEVTGVYTHGYPTGHQRLELARMATLALAAVPYSNPSGATQVKIDDYAEAYSAIAARMETARNLKAALRRQYGRRSGLVKVG
jgi:hypothetical protein